MTSRGAKTIPINGRPVDERADARATAETRSHANRRAGEVDEGIAANATKAGPRTAEAARKSEIATEGSAVAAETAGATQAGPPRDLQEGPNGRGEDEVEMGQKPNGRGEDEVEIERLRGELEQALGREERLAKDFRNYRRHAEAALERAGQEAREELLSELGEIIGHLEQAIAQAGRDPRSVREGIELVLESVERVLAEHGLERIPTVDVRFDPSIHEAVATERVRGAARGTVVRELSPGFRAGERVVRPARVSVAG